MIKKQSTPSRRKKVTEPKLAPQPENKAPGSKPYFYIGLIVVIIVTAAVLMVTNSFKKFDGKGKDKGPKQETQQMADTMSEVDRVIAKVAGLIKVNESETPTVATIEDITLLKANNPEFYKYAENGDRLLIWSDKAVLYSTRQDKLLSVMPIDMAEMQPIANEPTETMEMPTSTIASEGAQIQVRNGTMTPGMASKMAAKLKNLDLTISLVSDAKNKYYDNTIIIKLTNTDMPATLKELMQATGAKLVEQPAVETGLGGDFVVIVGNDLVE